jgi:hypothetical protein
VRSEPPARSHHPETGHFRVRRSALFVKPTRGVERMCDFDQLRGRDVYRLLNIDGLGIRVIGFRVGDQRSNAADWLQALGLPVSYRILRSTAHF